MELSGLGRQEGMHHKQQAARTPPDYLGARSLALPMRSQAAFTDRPTPRAVCSAMRCRPSQERRP